MSFGSCVLLVESILLFKKESLHPETVTDILNNIQYSLGAICNPVNRHHIFSSHFSSTNFEVENT